MLAVTSLLFCASALEQMSENVKSLIKPNLDFLDEMKFTMLSPKMQKYRLYENVTPNKHPIAVLKSLDNGKYWLADRYDWLEYTRPGSKKLRDCLEDANALFSWARTRLKYGEDLEYQEEFIEPLAIHAAKFITENPGGRFTDAEPLETALLDVAEWECCPKLLFEVLAKRNPNMIHYENMDLPFYRFKSPLFAAAASGNNELLDFLLKRGAKIHFPFSELHVAAYHGNTKGCEILLKAGADVNAIDMNDPYVSRGGSTPLTQAVMKHKVETVKFLISQKANPFLHSNHHGGPLSCAKHSYPVIPQDEKKMMIIQLIQEAQSNFEK